jgi:hypothetical protein
MQKQHKKNSQRILQTHLIAAQDNAKSKLLKELAKPTVDS